MFECKYKFKLEDSLAAAKYIYKSQKRKQDKIIAILLPILMVAMVAMLIVDIVNRKSFVWDIVLLIALIALEAMYLVIPKMLISSQKKSFKKQKLDEMDYLYIKIEDKVVTETLFKDEKEMAKNVHNLKSLTSYIEDGSRIILIFNNVEYVCIKKSELVGNLDKLKEHLKKIMAKSK